MLIVKAPSVCSQESAALLAHLNEKAEGLRGSPMIKHIISEAIAWLTDHGVDIAKDETEAPEKGKIAKKNKKKSKPKRGEEDESKNEKKKSMKTAIDVIQRILWDEQLPTECFSVGYLDRFLGIVEKDFSAFSWEDVASVDYHTLAIPKHRIQHFKYKKLIVWDKNERLDNVFGSLGGATIVDVMNRYDEEHQDDEDDSDDDDDICITVGAAAPPSTYEAETWQEDDSYQPFWEDKLRPNYFLALRITNPEIVSIVADIQDTLLKYEPRYSTCIVPPAALHVTLCCLGLDTAGQVADCVQYLQDHKDEIRDSMPANLSLNLRGVDDFYHRVLYAKVSRSEQFMKFVEDLKMIVNYGGFSLRDNHEFVPHMTIMKTTRPVSRSMGTKNIDPLLYREHLFWEFGDQPFDAIHLCSMEDIRQDDGFYITPTTITFD